MDMEKIGGSRAKGKTVGGGGGSGRKGGRGGRGDGGRWGGKGGKKGKITQQYAIF